MLFPSRDWGESAAPKLWVGDMKGAVLRVLLQLAAAGNRKAARGSGAEILCKALALWDVVDIVIPVRCIVSQPVISFYAKLKACCAARCCNHACEIWILCNWPEGVKWLLSFSGMWIPRSGMTQMLSCLKFNGSKESAYLYWEKYTGSKDCGFLLHHSYSCISRPAERPKGQSLHLPPCHLKL